MLYTGKCIEKVSLDEQKWKKMTQWTKNAYLKNLNHLELLEITSPAKFKTAAI